MRRFRVCLTVFTLAMFGLLTAPAKSQNLVSISVTAPSDTVTVGGTLQCTAMGTYSDGTTKDVTASSSWTSVSPAMATVGPATGLITGVAAGKVQIFATVGTIYGSTTVTVQATPAAVALQTIEITPNSPSVVVGSTLQLRAIGHYSDGTTKDLTTSATWNSSVSSTATVGPSTGLVLGVAAGSPTVIKASDAGVSESVQLSVTTSKPTSSPTAKDVENEDKNLRAEEEACFSSWKPGCLAKYAPQYQQLSKDALQAFQEGMLQVDDQPVRDARAIQNASPADVTSGNFSLTTSEHVSHLRVMGGIDASAAASTDVSARFLLDGDLDSPVSGRQGINSQIWIWAEAKLASMASPGAISGTSNLPTYVSSLTTASPSGVVQSFEASAGPEFLLAKTHLGNLGLGRKPLLISAIVTTGIVTPLSPSQSTPPIYAAPLSLQNYYVGLASQPHAPNYYGENASAVEKACGWTVSSSGSATPPTPTATCYITDVPQGRSSFFRNYAAGFRFKRYYYNAYEGRYVFPAIADLTIGQNDYVTGGQLRGWVMHAGGSTPIGGLPGVYLYASADVRVTQRNVSSQQFLLQAAPSNVTATDSDVAQLTVPQPNRDRYRFGIGLDVAKLCTAFKLCPSSATASTAPKPQ